MIKLNQNIFTFYQVVVSLMDSLDLQRKNLGAKPSAKHKTRTAAQSIIPRITSRFRIEDVGIDEAQMFMKSYMDRYGVTREAILILSVIVFLFSSISIATVTKTLIAEE